MSDTVFKSKIAVHRWLEENGWQISKSQFYDHCKDGLLRPVKSGANKGRYTLAAVEKYARMHCRQLATGQKENDRLAAKQEEKLDLELQRERNRVAREEFELERVRGRYVARAEFDLAITGRAVAFMAHINHTIQSEVQDWIALVEGDQTRAPELVDAIAKAIEQRMGDFAADAEFEVILEATG